MPIFKSENDLYYFDYFELLKNILILLNIDNKIESEFLNSEIYLSNFFNIKNINTLLIIDDNFELDILNFSFYKNLKYLYEILIKKDFNDIIELKIFSYSSLYHKEIKTGNIFNFNSNIKYIYKIRAGYLLESIKNVIYYNILFDSNIELSEIFNNPQKYEMLLNNLESFEIKNILKITLSELVFLCDYLSKKIININYTYNALIDYYKINMIQKDNEKNIIKLYQICNTYVNIYNRN